MTDRLGLGLPRTRFQRFSFSFLEGQIGCQTTRVLPLTLVFFVYHTKVERGIWSWIRPQQQISGSHENAGSWVVCHVGIVSVCVIFASSLEVLPLEIIFWLG